MVQRTEVVKAAEPRARQIVDEAEDEARRLRLECEDFCDQKLASFEIVLERTLKMVAAGRAKLQGNPLDRRGARSVDADRASRRADTSARRSSTRTTSDAVTARRSRSSSASPSCCADPGTAAPRSRVAGRARTASRISVGAGARGRRPVRRSTSTLEALSDGVVTVTGTVDGAVGGGVPPLPARRSSGELDGRRAGGVRAPTRSKARPTRSTATASTSSRWSATPCCSPCRSRRCAPTTAAGLTRDHSVADRDDDRPDPRWAALGELHFDL